MPRGKQHVDGSDERVRPRFDWAEYGLAPIEISDEVGHLAGADNPGA